MIEDFEEKNECKLVKTNMFYALWKSTYVKGLYYITNDFDFVKQFYAKNDKEALEIYYQ